MEIKTNIQNNDSEDSEKMEIPMDFMRMPVKNVGERKYD
jgi:hypothetical protein